LFQIQAIYQVFYIPLDNDFSFEAIKSSDLDANEPPTFQSLVSINIWLAVWLVE